MAGLLEWDISKIQWFGEVVGFEATIIPTLDEIVKHFSLPDLESKRDAPLIFKSNDGEEFSAMIFYLEKGSGNMKLWGWNTHFKGGAVFGILCQKCCIELESPNKAKVKWEKEHNSTVWDILLRRSDIRV